MSSVDFDYLSRLPASILARILSFLPAQDAARTVLLQRFGRLWTNIDRLDFDDHYYVENALNNVDKSIETLRFIRFVRYFLMFHQCSKLRKFRVRFTCTLKALARQVHGTSFDEREMWKLVREVEMWLKFAYIRGVEELDFGFRNSNSDAVKNLMIPEFVWSSDSVVELRLIKCTVMSPKKAWMGLLKTLVLDSITISNEALSKIIDCCPMLQDLGITDCDDLTKIRFIAHNIKNLRICMNNRRWKLMVNCPNVRSFDFSGYVEFVELVNLSSVKRVSFSLKVDFAYEFRGRGSLQFKRFLNKVQHAEALILDKVAFATLTSRVVQNHPCPRNKWKRIVLHTWLSRSFIEGICSMLRYSSSLEELIIHINDRRDYSLKGVELVDVLEGDDYVQFEEDAWSFPCLKQSLKNVTMHGLLSSSCNAQVDLARIILKNGLVLDRMVIFGDVNADSLEENLLTVRKLDEISKMLQAFPRVSEQASVYLLYSVERLETMSKGSSYPNKNVETKTKRKKQNSKRKRA